MKKYMLFGFDGCYPMGGMNDYIDSFDTIEEVSEAIKDTEYPCDYYHVYDTEFECVQKIPK